MVDSMRVFRVWHTADLIIPDCEGGCPEGDACERGWVDMSCSQWTVYENRENVRPSEYDPTDCKRGCLTVGCAGCLTPAEWLADRLDELPGGPESFDGHGTFYAADSDQNYAPWGRWETALRALHAEGFRDDELRAAWEILQARYTTRGC